MISSVNGNSVKDINTAIATIRKEIEELKARVAALERRSR